MYRFCMTGFRIHGSRQRKSRLGFRVKGSKSFGGEHVRIWPQKPRPQVIRVQGSGYDRSLERLHLGFTRGLPDLGFRVKGLRFRVHGLEFRV